MKKAQVRALAGVLAMVMVLLLMPLGAAAAEDVTVTIYHTNDIHGNVEQIENEETGEVEQLGLDRVATLKAATENALLVDAGDFSQGHMFANMAHGQSVVETMNAAGYDLAVLGNHEFDFTMEDLDENIALAEFPILSANVAVEESRKADYPNLAAMQRYSLQEVGGKKLAFFSVNTPELNGMVSPKKMKDAGLSVRTDIAAVAGEIVAEIRAEVPDVDAIIAVTHTGFAEGASNQTSRDVAMVEGVDVVIDGHDHQMRLGDTAQDVNGTLVVSTGTAMMALGKLELTFGDNGVTVASSNAFDEAKGLDPDEATQAVIDKWNADFDAVKKTVVFSSEVNLWGGNLDGTGMNGEEVTASIARRGETNAGTLFNDARMWKAQNWLEENRDDPMYAEFGLSADTPLVCITGGGSVRGSVKAGEITLEGLMKVYSFAFEDAENTYVLVTPKVLYDTIEHGVNIFSGQDAASGMLEADGSIHGRFPIPGGFSYEYDITQPASGEYDKDNMTMPATIGTRVQSITLDDGTVLDREDNETKLVLVTTPYQVGGGDSYWMLGALNDAPGYGGYQLVPEIATPAGNEGDAIIEYVNAEFGGVLPAAQYPARGHRITRVNDPYTQPTFEATLTATTDGTAALSEVDFQLFVNGEEQAVTSDAEGNITLTLDNGPNEVRLISTAAGFDSGTVYLDNYCGLHNAVLANNPGEQLPGGMQAETPAEEPPEPAPDSSVAPEPAPAPPSSGRPGPVVTWVLIIVGAAVIIFLIASGRKKK